MAAKAGYGGAVTVNGLTVGVKTWIINNVNEPLETTTLADGQTRTFIPGLNSFTGSFEGNWDQANTVAVGDTADATFYPGAGTALSYTGHIIISGLDVEDAFDGVLNGPITFQGSGTLPVLSSSSSSSTSSSSSSSG